MALAASMAGVAGAPKFAFGQSAGTKTFVKVFMRGGADGLHFFPPVSDIEYYNHRPNIAIRPPSDTDINTAISMGNGYRALNPNLAPLMEIYDAGRMMVAPATALVEGKGSHFDSMRYIGNGVSDDAVDGYLQRYIQGIPGSGHPLRAASLGRAKLGHEFEGNIVVPTINTTGSYELFNEDFCDQSGCADNRMTEMMSRISTNEQGQSNMASRVRENQMLMLETVIDVQQAGANYTPNAGGLDYSTTRLGNGLRTVAQLIKAGIPLEVAGVDWSPSFDKHSDQLAAGVDAGDQTFEHNRRLYEGALDFLTFYRDMGEHMDNVVLLVGTEFGRNARENGSRGTDHGLGAAWFAIGGPASGGMGPDVTSVAPNNLLGTRFIPPITDYRDLVAEIMIRHMNVPENFISTLLPRHKFTDNKLFVRPV